jgi:hypothetical protein
VKPSPLPPIAAPVSHFDGGAPGLFAASAARIQRTAGAPATAARRRHRAGLAGEEVRRLSILANEVRSSSRERAGKD